MASTAAANRNDPSAVFLNGRLISGVIYHADGSKENCYLQPQRRRLVEEARILRQG
jgi:hypothetical protein